jgi:NIMA (never in mitosis gene a)-related kinase
MQGFEVLNKLGEGAYSTVYKVRRKADGCIYALKQVRIVSLNEKEKSNAINEIRILASVRHPNVISYKEAFFDNQLNSLW